MCSGSAKFHKNVTKPAVLMTAVTVTAVDLEGLLGTVEEVCVVTAEVHHQVVQRVGHSIHRVN